MTMVDGVPGWTDGSLPTPFTSLSAAAEKTAAPVGTDEGLDKRPIWHIQRPFSEIFPILFISFLLFNQ